MTPFDALLAAGYGRSQIKGMSETDRQRLLADLRRGGAAEPDRRAQVAALSAASAARSGRLTAGD